ncbi:MULTISPECIES: toxin-antitoxin system, toxin component, HicA family protein [Micromonospora]|uniref:toxin-antitoxin system, toxin component, HicA family protein n=1 Tax=Micromonospora TaxID=1873 RepID=UPI0011CE906E|nr:MULTISPECIES: toxin-antitoxin system, toxin component, HicA family protein [Micromonospora]NES13195.1 toxin-antitoxin system, toxin component, HicA family protein [Micromonospora sp. PPF5-17B]NES34564.1 toxin-antitoxin system, toxin component, HicA family protein [Micromonospora solifontis]NES57072.1 toxin-antitoxin system, toxin component, HicA family protein [Micromonospora sp. PPF5-6]
MKRVDLINKISKAAADAGVTFRFGPRNVVIPRHKEINELTARGILRSLGLR